MTDLLWLPAAADRFSVGRQGTRIDRLVFHTSTTTFDNTVATFQGGPRLVSAHAVIDIDQDRIAECVKDADTAWGAGVWAMNLRCFNIETADDGRWNDPRPDSLYVRSAAYALAKSRKYGIPVDRQHWLRHDEVIATACPDAFDVDRVVALAKGDVMPFDPFNNPADLAKLDQRIRDVVMGEDIATFAVRNALSRELGNKGAKEPKTAPSAEDVQAGHGKGD
jgi:N-acetylmuramoyl-L-alanine amidase